MLKKTLKFTVIGIIAMTTGCTQKAPQLGSASIDEIIDAMTIEEKIHLLIGNGMAGVSDNEGAVIGKSDNIVPGAAGTTYAIPRLGIPSIVMADGPAGLRIDPTRENDSNTYYATHFPIGTLLASTWDPELVQQVSDAIGNETLEYGVDVLLAPGMNIQRHPLCGRNFEYYSEDPLLSGKIAAAYVRGVQNNGVGTSVKHFVANNQETNRTATDAIVSQRALREIYLKGFEIALKESDPWTLMTSYNMLNGIYTSENPQLLLDLLRNEWNYNGMVVTDWFGGKNSVAQVKAGNDMLQPGYQKQYDDILAAAKDGSLDMKDIDRNVKRILEMIVKTPRFKGYKYSNKPDLKAHAAITRQSACEGMILLKNDKETLPFDNSVKKIALFGNTSYDFISGGTGSGNVNSKYTVSLLEGLSNAGYVMDDNLKNDYEAYLKKETERIKSENTDPNAQWYAPVLPDEMEIPEAEINELAQKYDIAVITIGRNSGEFADRSTSDFCLSKRNSQLLQNVTKAFRNAGKKTVVLLNIGGAIETASWKNLPDAILLAWQGGQEGGNSVADIFTGKVNPSGKLTMTFPAKLTDPYSSLNFPMDPNVDKNSFFDMERKRGNVKNVDYTLYEEDVFVGYRYFDSFNIPVSYPFGYGLSYSSFKYDKPTLRKDKDNYIVTTQITNSGKYAGKEVVQLYVAAPDAKKRNQPSKVLKGFAKTKLLQPGETVAVEISVPSSELAFFDEEKSAWLTYPGEYKFMIGASCEDIRGESVVEVSESERKVNDILKPEQTLQSLKR